MKLLKYLLFILLIVVIGGGIFFGTKDGNFDVSKSKLIQAPASLIYDNVKDYKDWQNWGPWKEQDEQMEISYAEKTEGEGASYSWKSEELGDGSMKTIRVVPNKEIDQKIMFDMPMGVSESDVYWRFEETEIPGETKVTWGMKGEQSFMEKVFSAFQKEDFETSLGTMFDSGLNNIDEIVQKAMEEYSINVDGVTHHGGGYYMYNTTASRLSELGDKMGPMLGQVMGFIEENNLTPGGMPFTIYHEVDQINATTIFSACIPVNERVITPDGSPVICGYQQPVNALKTTLKGNYVNLGKAYEQANQYLVDNNLTPHPSAKMFEVYANDPGEFPNPADWITEIYIPLSMPTVQENQ